MFLATMLFISFISISPNVVTANANRQPASRRAMIVYHKLVEMSRRRAAPFRFAEQARCAGITRNRNLLRLARLPTRKRRSNISNLIPLRGAGSPCGNHPQQEFAPSCKASDAEATEQCFEPDSASRSRLAARESKSAHAVGHGRILAPTTGIEPVTTP